MKEPDPPSSTQEIFLQALEVPLSERAAFLDRACQDNPRMRAEMESLLEHHRPETLMEPPLTASERTWSSVPTGSLTRGVAMVATKILGGRKRRTAAWILAAVILTSVAWFTRNQVRQSSDHEMREQLRVVLASDVLAVETWIEDWKREANMWVNNPAVRAQAERLIQETGGDPERARKLGDSRELKEFTDLFQPFLKGPGESAILLTNREGLRLGTGRRNNARAAAFMVPILEGQTKFAPPSRGDAWAQDRPKDSTVASFVAVPVRGKSEKIVGILAFVRFGGYGLGNLLSVARMGNTGETYAISPDGLMLSQSRFDERLKSLGMIPNEPGASSVLTVQVRDPGGDLTTGYKPSVELEARPLTLIARFAVASRGKPSDQQTGMILEPYRDYRGVEVIGAWKWLPENDFGIITEVDTSEAFASLRIVSRALYALFGTLGVFVGLTLLATISLARARQREPRLGQYMLSKQIGEGGTSKVYLARHALLRRPTAVKVLTPSEEMPQEAIQRFEREVQTVCLLTHPNTIEIYDFGRTPNGTFYYAMEYLPGLNLGELVSLDGPVPAGRVIHILRQVCASLREAHGQGLVHRDIKPQNIMLCERGGEYDYVKVLDFGLVWQIGDSADMRITRPHRIIGTPLYMAPERISNPLEADVRSDIYSVGAVAYQLLSGRPVFRSVTDLELIGQIMHGTPDPLSELVPSPIPVALEGLVMNCISRDLSLRPQSVAEILEVLESIETLPGWTQHAARAWWVRCAPGLVQGLVQT
jgi:serine/threonine protein kinase